MPERGTIGERGGAPGRKADRGNAPPPQPEKPQDKGKPTDKVPDGDKGLIAAWNLLEDKIARLDARVAKGENGKLKTERDDLKKALGNLAGWTTEMGTTPGVSQADCTKKKVTIDKGKRKGATPEVLAQDIAHEAIHAGFCDNKNTVQDEYEAFKKEAEVWANLKGKQKDKQCDWIASVAAKAEAEAKKQIREALKPFYPKGVPEKRPIK